MIVGPEGVTAIVERAGLGPEELVVDGIELEQLACSNTKNMKPARAMPPPQDRGVCHQEVFKATLLRRESSSLPLEKI